MIHSSSYIEKLQEHFDARRQRNPSYSLRAFARDLNWSAPRLSEALNGKAGLSPAKADSIAKCLAMSSTERQLFTAMVTEKHGRSARQRDAAKATILKIQKNSGLEQVSIESFRIIRDWYHLAIAELLKVKGFKSSSSWISMRLGLSAQVVSKAIGRLIQVGILTSIDGNLEASTSRTAVGVGVPSDAIKTFHGQILNKAIDSIYGQPLERRHISASVVALNIDDLPKIAARIQDFRRELCAEFGSGGPKDSVYCISTQCFSLEVGVHGD